MVISHLPAGYIAAYYLEKKYWKDFSKKEVLWLYGVLLFFSVAPDFDLAYFWFVNGMSSHREFFTHSLLFYVFLALALYAGVIGWGKLKQRKIPLPARTTAYLNECPFRQVQSGGYPPLKKCERKKSEQKKCSLERFTRWIALCVVVGALSHLALDSVLSCVGWLWPVYSNPIGLPLINTYFEWTKNYYFSIFFAIELGVAVVALYKLINPSHSTGRGANKNANQRGKRFINAVSCVILTAAIFLPFAVRNSFYMPPDIGNRDFDNDGIKNDRDFDFDNDGTENLWDKDANGNGIGNSIELAFEAAKMDGVYSVDANIVLRSILILGLVSDSNILSNTLEKAGISLANEMNEDFMNNPDAYQDNPYNHKFAKEPRNIYAFFNNKKLLICDSKIGRGECAAIIKTGDILFFGANREHIAISVDAGAGEYSVIEAGGYCKKAVILGTSEMEQLYGYPQAIARLP